MRRRPTAVYRVLDEDDLLFGSDYLDAGREPVADDDRADPVSADPGDSGLGRRASGDGPPARRQVLLACAGALVVAVLVARLASILLAGTGAPRAGRSPSGRRPAPPVAARGLVSVPRPTGSAPPADWLTAVPSVNPGATRRGPVGRPAAGASGRAAASARTGLPYRPPGPTRPRPQAHPVPGTRQARSTWPASSRVQGRPTPSGVQDPRLRPAPSGVQDPRLRPAYAGLQDPRLRPAPSGVQDPRLRPAYAGVQGRPMRLAPSPAPDQPGLVAAPLAAEREFGFER